MICVGKRIIQESTTTGAVPETRNRFPDVRSTQIQRVRRFSIDWK